MIAPNDSPLKTGSPIPQLFLFPASTIGRCYGIPAETVAVVIGGVLGGILAGSLSVSFAGNSLPLGLHIALETSASPEATRWTEEISAPLIDEVMRLQRAAKDTSELEEKHSRFLGLFAEQAPGTKEYAQLESVCRNYAVLMEPFMFSFAGARLGENDGLGAQVLFPDLEQMLNRNDAPGLTQLAATFYGGSAGATAVVSVLNPATIRKLATSPLVISSPGWPMAFLPQSGADFDAVPEKDLQEARRQWRALVARALEIRYGPLSQITLSVGAMTAVNEMRRQVEIEFHHHGAEAYCRHATSMLLRLAGVHAALARNECGTVESVDVEAVLPLVRWSLALRDTVSGLQTLGPRKVRRSMPARATLASDLDQARKKLREFPALTDRGIMRKLARRPRGHWKSILVMLRAQSADVRADTTDTLASETKPDPAPDCPAP